MLQGVGDGAKWHGRNHTIPPLKAVENGGACRFERLDDAGGWYARVSKRFIKGSALCLTIIALSFTVPWKA